jgi:5-methylcytosine-specific restriction enzyme B
LLGLHFMADIKAVYEQQFLPARDNEWLASYRGAVERVQSADEAAFRLPEFQKGLWEVDGVTSIGPGSSVTVPGAYNDAEVIDALWSLKNWEAPGDLKSKAQYLDSEFERILTLVTPRHNKRRPSARLVRIFAVLRPYDIVCLMDSRRTAQFRQWVGKPAPGFGFIGQNVIARQAVREALGPERSLDDAISYSQFAWFVWELISAAEEEGAGASVSAIDELRRATDAPKLVLLPARMQRKGMFYVASNLQLLMSVVRAAENGMEKEDLMQQVGEEAPNLNRGSRQNVLAQAVSLNLLSVDGGTYRPTTAGRGLLEGGSASDMLTPTFVRTIFGFALILSDLRETGGLERGEIVRRAQTYYPRWTSERAPNALVAWLRDLGLATVQGAGRTARIELTEIGEYWASGLPADLKAPDHLLADAQPEDPLGPETADLAAGREDIFQPAPVDAVLTRFLADPDLRRFVFSEDQIRLVHAALHGAEGKRFILLGGLSGTGKTSMARAYARAYCEVKGLPPTEHYAQISVWPDWTDPSGLLGFVNPLTATPTFNETPALRLILEANNNPDKPYFLCLDEMNLARVEHYFAPFLSAMEGGGGRLSIHTGDNPVDLIPPSILWPRNLFIIGTVNMDETTHTFSDKVLDRAFTFEFWDVDLGAWHAKVTKQAPAEVLENVVRVMKALYEALVPARRHFGYRTCDEVLGFCAVQSGVPLTATLDAAVLAKVLPKVRGDSGGALPKALADAAEVCRVEGLSQSQAKLQQMLASLNALGTVRFWS